MEKILKEAIIDVPDFPKKGIIFKDLTPIFKDEKVFSSLIEYLYENLKGKNIDVIAGIESRGFLIGAPLALKLKKPFIPVRKPGKLPRETYKEEYELEYGIDALEIHKDAINEGDNVLIIDDLLATGGTALATAKLVEKAGGKVSLIAFIVELDFLNGRGKLKNYDIFSIVHY